MSAAWFDLTGRGVIAATGEDRVRLLHALTTNHIQQLQPGQGCYAFLLNPQGRIQSDLNVLVAEDRVLLDTEPETRDRVLAHIDHYIIADDVSLEDLTSRTAVLSVEGPLAGEVLQRAGLPVPESPFSHLETNRGRVARLNATGAPGFRIFLERGSKDETVARLEEAGCGAAGPDDVRAVRLEHGKPRYGEDIFDTSLVHETQQLYAVHFNKGCYTGQEIVERVRSRGMVNRLLAGLRIEGATPPAAGAALMAGETETGKITSAACSPAEKAVMALGYVRRENAQPGAVLRCEGRKAEVRPPYSP